MGREVAAAEAEVHLPESARFSAQSMLSMKTARHDIVYSSV